MHALTNVASGTTALGFVVGMVTACSSGEFVEQSQQRIVNGEMSQSDESVVALVYRGQQFCTGTMVGRRTVVTAAHCLPPHIDLPLTSIEVFFGNDISDQTGSKIPVVDGIANPSWNTNIVAGDVGVIAIAHDAPVEPMPMAYVDVTTAGMLGSDARAVGFGITGVNGTGNGTKRTGQLTIDRYDASSIYLRPGPSATCNGDSGGALLMLQDGVEVLGGIHSRSDCGSSIIAERVDVHTMDFIMPFMEEHEGNASCEEDGLCASGCAAPDPDCLCAADGYCTDSCLHPSADLDCTATCPADGVCDESCDYDSDCSLYVPACSEGDLECGDGDKTDGGCTTGGSSSASWMSGLLLLLFVRRRRTSN